MSLNDHKMGETRQQDGRCAIPLAGENNISSHSQMAREHREAHS